MLGFSLYSWAFRVLYAGLIKRQTASRGPRRVLHPVAAGSEAEQAYLQDYLEREANFEVFWGDLSEYAQRVAQRMQRAADT